MRLILLIFYCIYFQVNNLDVLVILNYYLCTGKLFCLATHNTVHFYSFNDSRQLNVCHFSDLPRVGPHIM